MPRNQPTHRSRDEVAAILRRFRESGLSQRAFSEAESISKHTLAFWVLRARREAESTTALVPITPPPRGPAEPFEVEISGIAIRVPRDASVDDWRTLREAWTS